MALWDGLITFAIVATAAYYLWHRFRKTKNTAGCGCSGNGCCAGGGKAPTSGGCASQH